MPLLSMNPNYNKLFMTYLLNQKLIIKCDFKNMPIGSAQKSLHEKNGFKVLLVYHY